MRRTVAARFAVLSALALAGLMAFAAAGALAKPQVTENYANFGPDGTESTDFKRINGVAYDQQSGVLYVLDGKAGTLSKFDEDGTPLPFTGTAPYIEDGVIEGISVNSGLSGLNESQLAVDSTSHVVYVTEKTSIRAFQADGEPAEFSAGPGKDTSEIAGFGAATGVTVDVNGAIYVSDLSGDEVSIFASSGALVKTFETVPTDAAPGNLAVAPGGALYAASSAPEEIGGSGEAGGVHKFTPSEFPVSPSTTYVGSPRLATDNSHFTVGVGVDPANGEVYVLETSLGDAWIKKFDSAGNFLRFFGGPEEEEERLGGVAQGIAIVGGGEEFQFYVGDTKIGAGEVTEYSKVAIYGEEIIEGPPTIKSTSAIDVTADSATLRGVINPNTAQTTYRFEYGTEDCALSTCTSVPLGGGLIPAGHIPVSVAQAIFGLDPATTYHYRILAENSFAPPSVGPDHTFTTQISDLGFGLADSRVWEMVTPTDKHGARLYGIHRGQIQAAADGGGLAYITQGSIEENPQASRSLEPASAIARRGAGGGWSSKDITPPHESAAGLAAGHGGEYKQFSADLAKAALDPRSMTLFSPEASERGPYLRENTEPATYTPLVTGKEGFANVPPGTEFGGSPTSSIGRVAFAGATEDLSHVVVSSEVPLAPGAAGGALYEWVEGRPAPGERAAGERRRGDRLRPDDRHRLQGRARRDLRRRLTRLLDRQRPQSPLPLHARHRGRRNGAPGRRAGRQWFRQCRTGLPGGERRRQRRLLHRPPAAERRRQPQRARPLPLRAAARRRAIRMRDPDRHQRPDRGLGRKRRSAGDRLRRER